MMTYFSNKVVIKHYSYKYKLRDKFEIWWQLWKQVSGNFQFFNLATLRDLLEHTVRDWEFPKYVSRYDYKFEVKKFNKLHDFLSTLIVLCYVATMSSMATRRGRQGEWGILCQCWAGKLIFLG